MTQTQTLTKPAVCGARGRQTGEPCQHQAGWGTPHLGYGMCKMHGGSTTAHRIRASKLQAAELPILMGMPLETEPHDALMQAVWLMAGSVEYAGHRVALLSTEAELEAGTPSEDARYWLGVRRACVEDLAKYAKMAIDAGVSERQVAVAEKMGSAVGQMLRDVLAELGLSPAQEALAATIVPKHLELVAGKVA